MLLRVSSFCLAALLIAFGSPNAARAQAASQYAGEIVIDTSGKPVAPWTERQICSGGTKNCRVILINSNTLEVAKVGARWTSEFEPTGRGAEGRRAEAAMAKAIRLKNQPKS